MLGTPRYMAPERIVNPGRRRRALRHLRASARSAYFLLTGKPVFEGDDNLELVEPGAAHAGAARVSESEPEVPEALDALIAASLEKDRARRPQSADAVIEALDRVASRLSWTPSDASAWWASVPRAAAHRDGGGRGRTRLGARLSAGEDVRLKPDPQGGVVGQASA